MTKTDREDRNAALKASVDLNVEDFLRNLDKAVPSNYPPFNEEWVKQLVFPYFWTKDNLSNKFALVGEINRKDLLVACFISYALSKGLSIKNDEAKDLMTVKEEFELDELHVFLEEQCQMDPLINPSDPFKFFLLLCLASENPLCTFYASWRYWHES